MKKVVFLLLFTFGMASVLVAQSAEYIWSPEISYSWKTNDRWAFNTKVSVFNSVNEYDNEQFLEFIEPQFSFAYSHSPRVKLGMGYYFRNSTPLLEGYQYEHRLLQQIGFITFIGDRRISHRVRLEQRIRSSSYQNRIRYRLSYDFPLEGEQLDEGERYLILKNELMSAFNSREADAENRAALGLGWFINRKQKLEIGIEYRTLDIFNDSGISHLFLLSTAFYLNR